ncbi:MAG TPA: hypothetical protein VEH28_03485 [Thermoplasmata archaeon]|nr:hypothetical protein [Thermoplasmata archaeon]
MMAAPSQTIPDPVVVSQRPVQGSGGTLGAMVMTLVGAALIFLQSVELLLVGSFYKVPLWGSLDLTATDLGGFGLFVAFALILLAILLFFVPGRHLVLGVGMLTFSLLSLYSGGGAILGFLLCYVASLIAIFARPRLVARAVPRVRSAEAAEDPVVEADLLDSGFAPTTAPAESRTP